MKRIFSQYALNIFQLRLDEWIYETHTHNFYELILVNEGSGFHHLNQQTFPFKKGDVFLLTPEDYHSFDIEEHTVFTYVKFTEQLFYEKVGWSGSEWLEKIKRILYMPNTIPESIIRNSSDQEVLFTVVGKMYQEFKTHKLYTRELMLELFGVVLTIIIRNLSGRMQVDSKTKLEEENRISELLTYIRQHIGTRQKLRQKEIASQFFLSPNYVSLYLKKHTGMGLQQMITETRLKTAERLLKQSTFTVGQIAEKSGFNDSSHMNKMFQKYRSTNPSEMRK